MSSLKTSSSHVLCLYITRFLAGRAFCANFVLQVTNVRKAWERGFVQGGGACHRITSYYVVLRMRRLVRHAHARRLCDTH